MNDSRRTSERRAKIAGIVAVLVVIVAALLWRGGDGGATVEPAATVAAEIELARVGPFTLSVSTLGVVVAGPGGLARVSAPALTRVTRIYVATGDAVASGQPLIDLDASVFRALEQEAQIALDAARQAHERASELVAAGISPRKEEEAAAADLARARAALTDARRTASLSTLRSPIFGIVTEIDAAVAQPVDASQALVQVVDPRALEVIFHLSPEEAGVVSAGASVQLEAPATTAAPQAPAAALGSGTIAGVSAAVDPATGTVAARARIVASTRPLRVGESVAGRIDVATHTSAVIVPAAAIVPDETGVHVFVVDGAGAAHETPVTVGSRTGDEVEITDGLSGGERVVTEGAYGVTDGATIRPPGAE